MVVIEHNLGVSDIGGASPGDALVLNAGSDALEFATVGSIKSVMSRVNTGTQSRTASSFLTFNTTISSIGSKIALSGANLFALDPGTYLFIVEVVAGFMSGGIPLLLGINTDAGDDLSPVHTVNPVDIASSVSSGGTFTYISNFASGATVGVRLRAGSAGTDFIANGAKITIIEI